MSNYEYNAPQFRSFTEVDSDHDGDESFFDVQEEMDSEKKTTRLKTPLNSKKQHLTPKSSKNDETSPIILKTPKSAKKHSMITRLDIKSFNDEELVEEVMSRSIKRGSIKRDGSPILNPSKFISLAENIMNFQKATPKRFRTKKIGDKFQPIKYDPKPPTVPMTPVLLSKERTRGCSYPTQEEKELQEIEEYQKHKEPPHPVNKKILENKYEITHDKHYTVPKPFNLSNPPKKELPMQKVEPFIFKAQPVPKVVISGPRICKVATNEEEKENKITKVKPFSFDIRDQTRSEKKKQMIKKMLEEEKKARVFRARPVPSYLHYGSTDSIPWSLRSPGNTSTSSRHTCIAEELNLPFKARSPKVLHRKPFQVKKKSRPSTQPMDIELNTEKRAKERAQFDEWVKENKEQAERLRLEVLAEEVQEEEEEIKHLRQETVHKPLPLPRSASKRARRRSKSC